MVVGAAADKPQSAGEQCIGQGFGIVDNLPSVLLKYRRQGLAKADGLAGDDVHQWSAHVGPGIRHGRYPWGVGFLAQNHAAAGPRSVLCVVVVT